MRGERLSINVEGRGGSDLDLDPDPDSWKILWIRTGTGKMMRILWIRIHKTSTWQRFRSVRMQEVDLDRGKLGGGTAWVDSFGFFFVSRSTKLYETGHCFAEFQSFREIEKNTKIQKSVSSCFAKLKNIVSFRSFAYFY